MTEIIKSVNNVSPPFKRNDNIITILYMEKCNKIVFVYLKK